MGITLSFGIQKGGAGKTTSTCMTSYILSRDYKVLTVDMDSQGNATNILTQKDIYQYQDRTVLNAMLERNPEPYIVPVTDTLHVLPADDILVTLDDHIQIFTNPSLALQECLRVIKDNYDFILIDLPPNLGKLTVNGLAASDFAVVNLQSEPLCWKALDRYLELLRLVQERANPNLKLAGILLSMQDSRAAIDSSIIDQVRKDYEDWVFAVTIRRRTRLKEFTLTGITDRTAHDRYALAEYDTFVEELLSRVSQ
ncbi:ParA family protein [Alicyclobacillus tolerans]|uniref:ParA family protein n=1 Tax=Alicyclobacillus tolerans TaxID=90970 RepID=UPI001F2A8829|nr:ParA family protein [Alicyclobacillus tolerans]MCF8568325.1 ParA family protein [Alicyclobacillus tolerans]